MIWVIQFCSRGNGSSVPVFAVRLKACDKVTRPRFHGDGLVVQGDDVRGDLSTVAVGLVPLQEEAGGRGVARLQGRREVQEGEGRHLVGMRCWGPETHLLAVRAGARLVHRLGETQKRREMRTGMRLRLVGWRKPEDRRDEEKMKKIKVEIKAMSNR